MNLESIRTTQGASPYDEYGLQVVLDTTPGTPDTDGTPIVCTDFTADFQPAEDWFTSRPEGFKEDGYSAVLREWIAITGNLAPDYDLLLWKFVCMFGMPVSSDPVTVDGVDLIDYEFRLPLYGSVNRPTFTAQWGRPDKSFRGPYGIIQGLSLASAANGNTTGNMTIMCQKGTDNNVMIGHGANEIQTIVATGLAAPANVVIPDTDLGDGGNVSITVDMTAAELRAAMAALPAINSINNVRVTGEIVDGDGSLTVTFINQLGLTNIGAITESSASLAITQDQAGSSVTVAVPDESPILPKHWWYRQGDNRSDTLDSDAVDMESHEITFGEMANPHSTENQSATFKDHVDGTVNVGCSIVLAYESEEDSLCGQMESGALGWMAQKKWHIFGADAPDGLRRLIVGIYGSVNAARARSNENNVYRKNFPISRKRNGVEDEGYSFFAVLRLPATV